ncbi:MAG: hypothetical protein NPINA01_29030 [Nitrospinaceae bacterium]|nr:MAG: hypothetical protein NPINA01_29030 [Nitrospinaceae bacterium]
MILSIFRSGVGFALLSGLIFSQPALADDAFLQLSTKSEVDARGGVKVFLTLKNTAGKPLFHIHPMFHFHHTNVMMPMIPKLEPGKTVTLENSDHPAVIRAGRYPLVVMAHYKSKEEQPVPATVLHTDSFYFQEPVESMVNGRIESIVEPGGSFLNVLLQNNSQGLKNVRMMLLLPPGVIAENFKGMMGFTLRGGEQKFFQVPVELAVGSLGGSYPVHLMIEYGEKLKHYTGEIRGRIQFSPVLDTGSLALHSTVIVLMSLGLYWVYRTKWKHALIQG